MPRKPLKTRSKVKSRTAPIRFTHGALRMVDRWAREANLDRSKVIRSLVDREAERRAELDARIDRERAARAAMPVAFGADIYDESTDEHVSRNQVAAMRPA